MVNEDELNFSNGVAEPAPAPAIESKPSFDFDKLFDSSPTSPAEDAKKVKKSERDYVLPNKLIGKAVSSLFSVLGKRYTEISDQLALSNDEIELLDAALKPFVDDYLIKTKTKASQISIILALVVIILPRAMLIVDAESKRHGGLKKV